MPMACTNKELYSALQNLPHAENGHANDCEQGSKTVGTINDDYTRNLCRWQRRPRMHMWTINRANGTCLDYASFRPNVSWFTTRGCHQA